MNRLSLSLSLLCLTACSAAPRPATPDAPAPAQAASGLPPLPDFQVDYRKEVLPNGLTLIVHEDRKAPIVAVNIWYHVGSKDEPEGKTGFAHLFEHLMFQGSENYKDEYFKPFEQVGATNMNGTTWLDRTNYFENVPTTALDLALWMESDRMGHFAGAIDQKLLDEQREVVKNEKRQGENRPYGRVFEWLQRASFPEGHPYRWTTIGSMADLDAASLDDVKGWFGEHYGAANVTLVLAGDIDFDTARAKVMQYFGDIPAGPPQARRAKWTAARTDSTRDVMQDRVAQPRLHLSWNTPAFGEVGADRMEIIAGILGGGRASRLAERLVHREQLADSVEASVLAFELAGVLIIDADIKPGVDPARVEAAIREEVHKLIAQGPRAEELDRARTRVLTALITGAEGIGGFGGKSDLLATCQVYTGDPGCVARSVERLKAFTPADLQAEAGRWLAQGDYTLLVEPYPQYQTAETQVDRSAGPPTVDQFPALSFPALQRARLSNGIEVVLAERHTTPTVHFDLLFDAGYASDAGIEPGTAGLTMAMLGEGTAELDAVQLTEREEQLGASISAGATLDTSSVAMSALSSRLDASLALYADAVLNPAFRDTDLQRLQAQQLSAIAQEKTDPNGMALRLLPPLMFGPGHPYGAPLTGSGTEISIQALNTAKLRDYQQRWLRPDKAQLVVVGDTTLGEVLPLLETHFGHWQPAAVAAGVKDLPPVALPAKARVFLIDRPGAQQSVIIGGLLAPPASAPDELAVDMMNGVLGGTFTSRLNMNLREDKGWSYGARSRLVGAVGQRLYLLVAPVQSDRTADSMAEILRETREYVGNRPARPDELAKLQAQRVRSLPGSYETSAAVAGEIRNILRLGRPDDAVQTLKSRVEALSLDQLRAAARAVVKPEQITWVITGDRARIEAGIRKLGIGELSVLNGDSQPLESPAP